MIFHSPLRGLSYRDEKAQIEVFNLFDSNPVQLMRAPENEYDTNAIEVHYNGSNLGFIAKEVAATLAPIMDDMAVGRDMRQLKATVEYGGGTKFPSFIIEIE